MQRYYRFGFGILFWDILIRAARLFVLPYRNALSLLHRPLRTWAAPGPPVRWWMP